MNTIVSAAAIASATAVPMLADPPEKQMLDATETPEPGSVLAAPICLQSENADADRAACLARAEQVVSLLRTRYIREGWKIDEEEVGRALSYCQAYAADGSDPDDGWEATMHFFGDHGISLDWIFRGDVAGLIWEVVQHSPRANSIADARLRGLAEEYLEAERRSINLINAVSQIDDNLIDDRRNRAIPDTLRWRESDAELGLIRPKDDEWRHGNAIFLLRGEKWLVYSSVETTDEFSASVRMVTPSAAQRARAQEIVAAYDEWSREQRPPRGYKKLASERDKAQRIADRLLKRVAEAPAETIQGLFAKARCAVGPSEDIESAAMDMVGNPAGDMALSIFDDVGRLARKLTL